MKVLTLEMLREKTARIKKNRRKRTNNNNKFNSSTNKENGQSENAAPLSRRGGYGTPQNYRKDSRVGRDYNLSVLHCCYHQYVSMDCEMVGVGCDGRQSMLARVTIIDGDCRIMFDKYVKPTSTITDYRTFVSGILPEHLDEHGSNAENLLGIEECRAKVREVLRDKTLVGHALQNDLTALGIHHPWHQIRDTAEWGPFMKVNIDNNGMETFSPRKLKELVREKLHYEIQKPGKAHNAYEDAMAALELYRCVQQEWEKVITYNINYAMQAS